MIRAAKTAIALAVTGLAVTSCSSSGAKDDPSPSVSRTPYVVQVAYYVGGTTNQASITYSTASGTAQQSDIDVPMKTKDGPLGLHLSGAQVPRFLYISAQNSNEYGTVNCRIEVDGVVVASNESSGAYTIASCQGSL